MHVCKWWAMPLRWLSPPPICDSHVGRERERHTHTRTSSSAVRWLEMYDVIRYLFYKLTRYHEHIALGNWYQNRGVLACTPLSSSMAAGHMWVQSVVCITNWLSTTNILRWAIDIQTGVLWHVPPCLAVWWLDICDFNQLYVSRTDWVPRTYCVTNLIPTQGRYGMYTLVHQYAGWIEAVLNVRLYQSCLWHDSLMCVAWLIHTCGWIEAAGNVRLNQTCVIHDSFMCVWHDAFMCVTRLFHTRSWIEAVVNVRLNQTYVIHDSFTCVWHESSTHIWLHWSPSQCKKTQRVLCVTRLIHVYDMTHSLMWHCVWNLCVKHTSVWHESLRVPHIHMWGVADEDVSASCHIHIWIWLFLSLSGICEEWNMRSATSSCWNMWPTFTYSYMRSGMPCAIFPFSYMNISHIPHVDGIWNPLMEEIRLSISGFRDLSVFQIDFSSDGVSVYTREILYENLGTPLNTCWIYMGTSVNMCGKVW